MEKTGFIYIWFDRKHKRYYIGSHLGSEDDGYICSSRWMKQSYKRRPYDFKRRIIQKDIQKSVLKEEESKWLSLIKSEELGTRYYNLSKIMNGNGWEKDKPRSEETKKKVSEGVKKAWTEGRLNKEVCHFGNPERIPWNKGKKGIYSDETKNKISKSVSKSLIGKPSRSKGTKRTEEWKKQQSDIIRAMWKDGKIQGNRGKSPSLETRKKLSDAGKGNQNARKHKT